MPLPEIISICISVVLLLLLIRSMQQGRRLPNTEEVQENVAAEEAPGDKMFITIGHDIKSASNLLNSFNKLLDYGDIPPAAMKVYTDDLKRAIRDNNFLMENVFNWGTSQSPDFKPAIEDFDIGLRVNDVMRSLAMRAASKNITILNSIPEGAMVRADLNMTELVLKNLIHNAIKYTHAGGTIELSAEAEGDKLRLLVKDPGMGMPEAMADRLNKGVFLQFFKSTPGTEEEQGTGVGLILCKHFLRLMNARISVQSEPDKGSVFALHFVQPA